MSPSSCRASIFNARPLFFFTARPPCLTLPPHTLPPPFPSPARSGSQIKQRQQGSSVFLQGPEGSPALRSAAAQPRPVLSYQLERPSHASSYASDRGQQQLRSSISMAGMASGAACAHAVPPPRESSVLPEERSRAMAESAAAAKSATALCNTQRQKLLSQQFTIS